jgi:hypothetical protein
MEASMARSRAILATVLSLSFAITPLWGSPSAALGTVVYSDSAQVGTSSASIGSSVFSGDRLSTASNGSMQVRAGAARFLLSNSSVATLLDESGTPGAVLSSGSATFSTANSKAFAMHFGSAVIRADSDMPTIGHITVLGPRELVVKCVRGSLNFSVDEDSRIVAEGTAYRVIIDPTAAEAEAQGPRGAGSKNGGAPIKAGRSRFIWFAIAITAAATVIAVHAALESPDRP